ncbi:MAG: hypothetical protein K2L53_00625, partial [Clostridia bacterium]|nr:hypothetical protein [Clostridia bacterium]
MKAKTLKRISLISILIIAALVASLVALTFMVDAQPQAQAATETLYKAEYQGDNGTLPDGRHETIDGIAAKYGVTTSQVFSIQSGLELYKFLNGDYSGYKVGFLTRDVAMSYNSPRDGYDNITENSSAAIFGDIFDGNGYTVKIYGGAGTANSTQEIKDDDGYRLERRNGAARYDSQETWYEFTGYMVAQNYGKLVNFTIDYTSPHSDIVAINGSAPNADGSLGMNTTDRLFSYREGVFSAGIIAGLNGYGGVIDNVKINVNNAFTAIKRAGKTGKFIENGAYVGAIAGRAEDNSKINNCWVDFAASNTGVFAGAQGKSGANLDSEKLHVLAIAGGFVGNMDIGTAQLTYCALTGNGVVKGFGNRAAGARRFKVYAGGAVGACIRITGEFSVADCYNDDNLQIKDGQIQGIISSWTGSRFTNMDNQAKETLGMLFGAVGSDDYIKSVALLYNFQTLTENNSNGTHFDRPVDSTGRFVLDSAKRFKNWLEINPASDGGTMTVMFDYDNPNYDIRVHIVA